MSQGLLLVDIQNDYFPGGAMELKGMDEAAENALLLLQHFRRDQLPVFHIRHIATGPSATFFLPDTNGAKTNEVVAPTGNEVIIEKHFPNAFRDTPLLELLKTADVKEVVICGAMSHMCIDATTRAAFDLSFQCTVASDACATRDLEHNGILVEAASVHASFMAALASAYADVIPTRDYL